MSVFADLSKEMANAVENAGASVVRVEARRRIPATGIAFEKEYILTASHVVQRDENIRVVLPDGTVVNAEVAGRDYASDLALLKLEEPLATPAKTTDEIRVGQMVLAIGRPGSNGLQASLGIVSAQGGPMRFRGGILEQHLRTDAIPYPGFSGGPLVDAAGDILGINTSGLGMGNSIAIPAALAWKIAAQLKEHGTIKRGFLGVRAQAVDLPENSRKNLGREQATGLLIIGTEKDSPAKEAGLIAGDVLTGINGEALTHHDELLAQLSGDVVGSESELEVLRGGERITLTVTVTERPKHRRGMGMGRGAGHGSGHHVIHRRKRGQGGGRGQGRRRIIRKMMHDEDHDHDDHDVHIEVHVDDE